MSQILSRCLNRCPSADWAGFQRRYARRVRRAIVSALSRAGAPVRPEEVEDLTQELYCRLLTTGRRGRIRAASEAQGWRYVAITARSVVADGLRARRTAKRSERALRFDRGALENIAVAADLSPEARVLLGERAAALERRLAALVGRGPRALKVAALRHALFLGWTSREIVHASGGALTVNQIDTLVSRVRRALARDGILVPRRKARRSWSFPPPRRARGSRRRTGTGAGAGAV